MNHYLTMLRLFEHLSQIKDNPLFSPEERVALLKELRILVPHDSLVPGFLKTRQVLLNKIEEIMRPNVRAGTIQNDPPDHEGQANEAENPCQEGDRPSEEKVLNRRGRRPNRHNDVEQPRSPVG